MRRCESVGDSHVVGTDVREHQEEVSRSAIAEAQSTLEGGFKSGTGSQGQGSCDNCRCRSTTLLTGTGEHWAKMSSQERSREASETAERMG